MKAQEPIGRLKEYQTAVLRNRKGTVCSVAALQGYDNLSVRQYPENPLQAVGTDIHNKKASSCELVYKFFFILDVARFSGRAAPQIHKRLSTAGWQASPGPCSQRPRDGAPETVLMNAPIEVLVNNQVVNPGSVGRCPVLCKIGLIDALMLRVDGASEAKRLSMLLRQQVLNAIIDKPVAKKSTREM